MYTCILWGYGRYGIRDQLWRVYAAPGILFPDVILRDRPDIVLHNKVDNICVIVDVAVPNNSNVSKKNKLKILRLKSVGRMEQKLEWFL